MKLCGKLPRTVSLLLALALVPALARAEPDNLLTLPGVVVEDIGALPVLNQSGLKSGDVLVSWRQPASHSAYPSPGQGNLETILDWHWLILEKAPTGPILLVRSSQGWPQEILIPMGLADLKMRPNFKPAALSLYDNGKVQIDHGDIDEGLCWWKQLARLAQESADPLLAVWLRLRMAAILSERNQWNEAVAILELALREEISPTVRAAVLEDLGTGFRRWGKTDLAREAYNAALTIQTGASDNTLALARVSFFLALIESEQPNPAGELLDAAVEQIQLLAPRSTVLASALNNRGIFRLNRGEIGNAQNDYELAFLLYTEIEPGSLNVARVMNNLGRVATASGQLLQAREWHREALRLRNLLAPCSLEVAQSLQNLAFIEAKMGDPEKGKSLLEQALAILHDFPGQPRQAGEVIESLGFLAARTGNLREAETSYRRALALFQQAKPRSLDVARAQANLSTMLSDQGDLQGAEDLLIDSLKLGEEIAPEGLGITQTLTNIGLLKIRGGKLDEAEDFLKRSLRIIERIAPGTFGEAAILNNLGMLAFERGDTDDASYFDKRSLEVARRLPRPNIDEAHSLNNLGNVAITQGNYAEAEDDFKESLAIKSKLLPGSSEVASGLGSLAHLYWIKGDSVTARKYFEASLSMQPQATSTGSPRTVTLINLATILMESGELEGALTYFIEARDLTQEINPESVEYASSLHGIGEVLLRQGRHQEALEFLRTSANIINTSLRRLGGTEDVKASLRSRFEDIYRDLVSLLIETGERSEAFKVLESYRARALLNMLAARDLNFSGDLPPGLESERKKLEYQYDAAQQNILQGNGGKEQLLAIRSKLNEIARQMDRFSLRLSTIRDPKPLDLEAFAKRLDPGTVMLYYEVDREETRLWIVETVRTAKLYRLSIPRRQLEEDIRQYLSLIQGTRGTGSPRWVSLVAAGKHLYEKLVAPAEEALARSQRVLFVPDGSLRLLPFAGLVRSSMTSDQVLGGRGWQFLAEWKPMHTALSATLFAELKATRHSPEGNPLPDNTGLAAFGDPTFSSGLTEKPLSAEGSSLRSAAKHGFDFSPLPFSRQEVEGIVSLFPRGAKAFLGPTATEGSAKSLPRNTHIVHFATHAILDDRFPLNSAVVLSIPEKFEEGKDNGLLQAWEIFEQVRLDADLVVLSACESGLGKEMGGEGLIGLTRAFQYAGARSVMASLWKISDRTTAELMVRFYKHLKDGMSKDEALRAAQMELIQGPSRVKNEKGEEEEVDASAPYYWAAFQIYGDWQ